MTKCSTLLHENGGSSNLKVLTRTRLGYPSCFRELCLASDSTEAFSDPSLGASACIGVADAPKDAIEAFESAKYNVWLLP